MWSSHQLINAAGMPAHSRDAARGGEAAGVTVASVACVAPSVTRAPTICIRKPPWHSASAKVYCVATWEQTDRPSSMLSRPRNTALPRPCPSPCLHAYAQPPDKLCGSPALVSEVSRTAALHAAPYSWPTCDCADAKPPLPTPRNARTIREIMMACRQPFEHAKG